MSFRYGLMGNRQQTERRLKESFRHTAVMWRAARNNEKHNTR